MNSITQTLKEDWYISLVEECKAIITEAVFTSKWALVEGNWQLGRRVREDKEFTKFAKGNQSSLQGLARNIGVSERTLYYALQLFDTYPQLDKIPEGKNISMNKLITSYLPRQKKQPILLTNEQKKTFKKQVVQGDCIEEMGKMPDKSIDMIYVDPPYNVNAEVWDTFTPEEFGNFTQKWITQCLRLLKDESNFYIHFPADKIYWLQDFILRTFNLIPTTTLIWNYRNLVQGRDAKNKYLSTYQPILHYNFGNKELNFDSEWSDERFDVWNIATPQSNFNEGKYHKTQKPLELMERLVKTGSRFGELVLDPMAGSGSTGIACAKNNRDFILIEREQEYIDIIYKRLNDI